MKNQIYILLAVFLFAGAAFAEPVEDKEIVNPGAEGRWNAEIVGNHEIWNREACMAYIDNAEGARFEIVSFYSQAAEAWTQPMVHVVTPVGLSFLNLTFKVVGKNTEYEALEVLTDSGEMVAGRTTFMEPQVGETLMRDLRNKNSVKVTYSDAFGEVQSMNFRLSGSSVAINAQFKECGLKFKDIPSPVKLEEIQ